MTIWTKALEFWPFADTVFNDIATLGSVGATVTQPRRDFPLKIDQNMQKKKSQHKKLGLTPS